MSDLIDEYLDSLPPDERHEQERAIADAPWLRLVMERSLECTSEERQQLMAEMDVWSETGELDPYSLLASFVEEGEELKQAEVAARVRAAGGRSALIRFLVRSGLRKPSRPVERLFSEATPPEQAYLYWLMEFVSEFLLIERDLDPEPVARLREHGYEALELGQDSYPAAFLISGIVAKAAQELLSLTGETPTIELLATRREFADGARRLRDKFPWGYWLRSRVAHEAGDLLAEGLGVEDEEVRARLHEAVEHWQRLIWVSECLDKQGIYLGGKPERFPPNEAEVASLLCELSYDLEPLLMAPEMLRELPLRPDSYLYRRHATPRLLEQMRIRTEPALAFALGESIRSERHYSLDHIARIELSGRYGVERLTLAPERWNGDAGYICYLVAHKRGSFIGETSLAPPGVEAFGWPALTNVPAFALNEPGTVEGWSELYAPLTNLVLAAWRNIVVPRVRDEHYEVTVRRKPKGSGQRAGRQARRGDLAVVEYLPRTLALRRAEEAERKARGDQAPLRRVYRVGNFVKALPDGQHRSADAHAFAREIGMPLADWQTVVRAHFRGGTPEEREAAELAETVPLKEWRSWDALDLLASRAT